MKQIWYGLFIMHACWKHYNGSVHKMFADTEMNGALPDAILKCILQGCNKMTWSNLPQGGLYALLRQSDISQGNLFLISGN